MTGQRWSSPFGARPISAASVAAEVRLRARQKDVALRRETGDAPTEGRVADKWHLLRALSESAGRFDLSDRTVCVLEALLSFQPGKEIDGGAPVIVFPSNRELSVRSRGMAPATLRRHLALLVEAGFILRRDSPNGKRFRRSAADGASEAFGFDVSPLAWRAGEIFEAATVARRESREATRLRSAISIHRRDLRKVLECACAENRPGDWAGFAERLLAFARLPVTRGGGISELERAEDEIVRLRAEIESAYLGAFSEAEMSANDAKNERHYQNPEVDNQLESKARDEGEILGAATGRTKAEPAEDGRRRRRPTAASDSRAMEIDLATVLRLCPDIGHYTRQPLRSWRDLEAVADLVRGFLGISFDAYAKARAAMGEIPAAVVIAAMLQRAERIRSPGGYLRNLTAQAAEGRFRVDPMLRALEGAVGS